MCGCVDVWMCVRPLDNRRESCARKCRSVAVRVHVLERGSSLWRARLTRKRAQHGLCYRIVPQASYRCVPTKPPDAGRIVSAILVSYLPLWRDANRATRVVFALAANSSFAA